MKHPHFIFSRFIFSRLIFVRLIFSRLIFTRLIFVNTLGSLMLAGMLSGCATPTYAPETARDAAGQLPSAWSSVADSQAVEAGWISAFADEVLSTLVLEGQHYNRELQGLAASVEQANALTRQAGAALLPSVNLEASSSRRSEQSTTTDVSSGNLQASWEIDLWGRLRSIKQAAQADAQTVAADYQFAQYSLAASIARGYFAAIDAAIQRDVANRSVENLERIYQLIQLQTLEGVASAQDLAVTQSDLAAARSRLIAAKGAHRNALRALQLLLGRYPSAEIELRDTLPAAPPAPAAGLPSELLERRADIVAAERRVAAAFARVNVAKTARLPSLSMTTLFGGSATELSSLLDPNNRTWSAGGSLLAPIFQGGALKAQVEQANSQQRAAIAAYAQSALNAFADVESALDAGATLARQERQLSDALTAANEAYRIAKFRFDEGDMELFDLLSVEQRTFERRVELTSVQRELLDQRVNLYLALGGSWE